VAGGAKRRERADDVDRDRGADHGEHVPGGDELMAALTERDLELTRLNERIHAAEMQETGRRLAAERRELEAAEEKAYPDDFHRRFGQRELLPAAPANAEEAERREIAGRLGLPIEQVV